MSNKKGIPLVKAQQPHTQPGNTGAGTVAMRSTN